MENNNQDQVIEDIQIDQDAVNDAFERLVANPEYDVPEENSPVTSDRHTAEYPFKDEVDESTIEEKDLQKKTEIAPMPTATYKEVEDYGNSLDEFGNANFVDNFSEKDKRRARQVLEGTRFTVRDNVYADTLNANPANMVNNIQYGDKDINIRYPKLGTTGEATGNVAIAKINSILNIGEVTQVPLWHSGIWVTFKAPTQKALINLDIALTNSQITLGRNTNTLIFSNYQVIVNRILCDFLMEHITAHTLKVPEDKQLQDYILVQDYYPLILGMLSSMFPNGIYNTRGCANVAKLTEQGSPACDYVINSTLDPKKLLWVNRKVLTKGMLEHMSNRRPTSMSATSVIEYQKSIKELMEKEVDLKTAAEGVKVSLKLGTPTLNEYIDKGELWVNEIIKESESLFTEGDNEEKKNEKIMDMLSSKLLGIYNTYVKEIKVNDIIVKDFETIEETLAAIGIEEEILTSFFTAISKYITESAIAMVAIPSYTCPKCGVDHSEGREGPFKSFIPLNLVEHFFVLSAFRLNRTRRML